MLVVGIWDRTGHGYTAPTKASSLRRRHSRMLKRACLYLFHLHKEHTRKTHTHNHTHNSTSLPFVAWRARRQRTVQRCSLKFQKHSLALSYPVNDLQWHWAFLLFCLNLHALSSFFCCSFGSLVFESQVYYSLDSSTPGGADPLEKACGRKLTKIKTEVTLLLPGQHGQVQHLKTRMYSKMFKTCSCSPAAQRSSKELKDLSRCLWLNWQRISRLTAVGHLILSSIVSMSSNLASGLNVLLIASTYPESCHCNAYSQTSTHGTSFTPDQTSEHRKFSSLLRFVTVILVALSQWFVWIPRFPLPELKQVVLANNVSTPTGTEMKSTKSDTSRNSQSLEWLPRLRTHGTANHWDELCKSSLKNVEDCGSTV